MDPLALVINHHRVPFHPHEGSPVSYAGVAAAAFASWVGVPGAGEAALVTAAAFASRDRLDIGTVELFAFAGALVGGMLGWLIGRRLGAPVVGAPGPFYYSRRKALRAGERFFDRWGIVAVFFTPSWVAGVHKMSTGKYLVANGISALLWAIWIGLGTYFIGPEVADVFGDIGVFGSAALVAVIVIVLGTRLWRRRAARERESR